MRTVQFVMIVIALTFTAVTVACAAESAPTKAEVDDFVKQKPLTLETWPEWRDYYVRLFYAYEIDEKDDFYSVLYSFVGNQADQNMGRLTGEFADDPVAAILLANYYLVIQRDYFRAEEASRKALALGDPSGMSRVTLIYVILASVYRRSDRSHLTPENVSQLDEVEKHLTFVEQNVPQAKVSILHGLLAWNRKSKASAVEFLKQATIDHPNSTSTLVAYLTAWVSQESVSYPMAATTQSCVDRFPDNPAILAFHSLALYSDGQFVEAFETLQKVRQLDASAADFLGELNERIDKGQWMTPAVLQGLRSMEREEFTDAAAKFEKELNKNPDNYLAARFMARCLVNDIRTPKEGLSVADKCESLCAKFPNDAELHLAWALALSSGGRWVAANRAMLRSQELGGDVVKMAGEANVQRIRDQAKTAENRRLIHTIGTIALASVAGWVVSMFVVGAVLARLVSLQANPDSLRVHEDQLSTKEIWIERTYLVLLTVGLIVFYLSLPVVCLGLLLITIAMFLMMYVLRVIHFGILYRGYFAVEGVIKSAMIGPSFRVLGMEVNEEQHPRLFEVLAEVADRMQTRQADAIYVTPLPEMSVYDRGTGPFGLFNRRRVMQIGLPTLSCLSVAELKSVLAHEFAHFSHQHTFYSRFIFQVSAPLSHSLAVMSAAGGGFNYINPFYGFFWLYLKGYELLAAGFSRSHEFLADRRSAFAYGKDLFLSSLAKSAVEGSLFVSMTVKCIKYYLSHGRVYVNAYEAMREFQKEPENQDIRQTAIDGLLKEKPGWYDSHPTYAERASAVDSIPNSSPPVDTSSAVDLLDGSEVIEVQLSDMLTEYIAAVSDIVQVPEYLKEE